MKDRIRVLIITECNLGTAVWMRPETKKPADEYYEDIGRFFMDTLAMISARCRMMGKTPCIHIKPKVLTEEQFSKLDKATWHMEMEGLISDVEQGKNSS